MSIFACVRSLNSTMPGSIVRCHKFCRIFSRTPGGEATYGCSIPLCKKLDFRCIATTMCAENPWRWQIFLRDGRSKVPPQSIDLLSCGVGCEFHHHHDCNCAAGGRRKFPVPQRASIGSHHTIAELAQCSLINCWSHVQNVTRGPWPCMQARGVGRRKRPWSDLPVPSVAIRKKSALAVLTPKERARGNKKLQVAVSRAHCLRVRPKTSGVERVNLPKLRYHQSVSSKLICPRHCERGRANARPMAGSAK